LTRKYFALSAKAKPSVITAAVFIPPLVSNTKSAVVTAKPAAAASRVKIVSA
jgi:hypothetical protein